jgi:hypothetical protein
LVRQDRFCECPLITTSHRRARETS